VANCQLGAEICYIPPTRYSNRPGETREWWNPIGRSRTLTGPRGRNSPGGASHEGALIRPDWGGVAVRRRRLRPSGHARVGVGGEQLALRVRSALARTRARAGGSASAWAWGPGGRLPGDERRV